MADSISRIVDPLIIHVFPSESCLDLNLTLPFWEQELNNVTPRHSSKTRQTTSIWSICKAKFGKPGVSIESPWVSKPNLLDLRTWPIYQQLWYPANKRLEKYPASSTALGNNAHRSDIKSACSSRGGADGSWEAFGAVVLCGGPWYEILLHSHYLPLVCVCVFNLWISCNKVVLFAVLSVPGAALLTKRMVVTSGRCLQSTKCRENFSLATLEVPLQPAHLLYRETIQGKSKSMMYHDVPIWFNFVKSQQRFQCHSAVQCRSCLAPAPILSALAVQLLHSAEPRYGWKSSLQSERKLYHWSWITGKLVAMILGTTYVPLPWFSSSCFTFNCVSELRRSCPLQWMIESQSEYQCRRQKMVFCQRFCSIDCHSRNKKSDGEVWPKKK